MADKTNQDYPKYKQVSKQIEQYIILNKMGVGARLPGGRYFADKFDVSKNTVFEAFDLLASLGLIEVRKGSGAYVAVDMADGSGFNYAGYIKKGWQTNNYNKLLDLLQKAGQENIIYLGTRSLHEDFGYKQLLTNALKKRIDENKLVDTIDTYNLQGALSFRKVLSERLKRYDVDAEASDILITSGNEASVDMVLKVLLSAGDTLFVEQASTYPMLLQASEIGINIVELATNSDGICLEDFKRKIPKAKRAIVIISSILHQTSGINMSVKRCHEIVKFCEQNNIIIVEVGREFVAETHNAPALKSIQDKGCIYVDSIAYPYTLGLNVSWVVAPKEILERIALLNVRTNLSSFNLNNIVVEDILADGSYDDFIATLPAKIEQRMVRVDEILNKYLKEYASWKSFGHGLVAITMNDNINVNELFAECVSYGVVFIPGDLQSKEYSQTIVVIPLRLSLEEFEEGIKRIKELIEGIMK